MLLANNENSIKTIIVFIALFNEKLNEKNKGANTNKFFTH
jgi:hypothetical protein